jgi:hypothetical protein
MYAQGKTTNLARQTYKHNEILMDNTVVECLQKLKSNVLTFTLVVLEYMYNLILYSLYMLL